MGWIDYDKVKANRVKLAEYAAVMAAVGIATWYNGRFWAFVVGIGIAALFVMISVVNYWIRNAKGS